MKLKELLKLINEEVFLTVEDYATSQEVEGEVGNSIIQRLDGEVTAIRQMDRGQIVVTVDFARGEE